MMGQLGKRTQTAIRIVQVPQHERDERPRSVKLNEESCLCSYSV